MKLLRPSELKWSPGHIVFRQSRFAGTIRAVGLGTFLIAAGPIAGFFGFPWFIWVPCLLVAFVPALLIMSTTAALYRESNWILAIGQKALWINLRSHLNHHLPEGETVVKLEIAGLVKVTLHSNKYSTPGADGGSTSWAMESLQFELTHDQTQPLVEALKQERNREPLPRKFGWSSFAHHYPVSVPEPNTIRIAWRGSTMNDRVIPCASKAIQLLAAAGVQTGKAALTQRADWSTLSKPELESLLKELALSGQTIEAVKLLRERKGLTLTEATRQVNEVRTNR